MKKRIVTLLMVVLVAVLAAPTLTGCFFENLSIISGTLNAEASDALAALNTELVTEDENGDLTITLSNFTQLNKSSGSVGGYSGSAIFEFKCAENGFYISSYTSENVSSASDKYEYYIEKDGEYWFAYAQNPNNHNEWKVAAIDMRTIAMRMSQNATASLLEETRKNIFNPKNYKPDGDHYKYAGPTLLFSEEDGGYKMVFNVAGLFTIENGIEIKGKVEPEVTAEQKEAMEQQGVTWESMGLNIPFSYSIYDVGTTKITFPSVINSDYKANYKAAKESQNDNGGND